MHLAPNIPGNASGCAVGSMHGVRIFWPILLWFSGILAPVFTRGAAVKVSFHQVGFGFALCAWLMQLSVFLTPIFMKHPEIGFGVCEQLAVVADALQVHTSNTDHGANGAMAGMDMSAMPDMPGMAMPSAQSHTPMSTPPASHAPHHSHTSCAFCMVFGHLAPFDLAPLMVILTLLLFALMVVQMRANATLLLTFNHRLLPPGRAPPAISLI